MDAFYLFIISFYVVTVPGQELEHLYFHKDYGQHAEGWKYMSECC